MYANSFYLSQKLSELDFVNFGCYPTSVIAVAKSINFTSKFVISSAITTTFCKLI